MYGMNGRTSVDAACLSHGMDWFLHVLIMVMLYYFCGALDLVSGHMNPHSIHLLQ